MNELSTISKDDLGISQFFPNNNLQNLMADLIEVNSWDDFARRFLLGEGKSKETYRSYLASCKQFYDFTGGLHPMQAGTPEWIEQFYDALSCKDLNSKAVRMRGLKFMYRKIEERFPFYTSPFDSDVMSEALTKKLFKSKTDISQKGALTMDEYKGIIRMLKGNTSPMGLLSYAVFRFGVMTGVRAHEFCNLTWDNFSKTEEGLTVTFMGKGSKVATIQVEEEAYKACRRAFRARYGKSPQPTDFVFNSMSTIGISKVTLHARIKEISAAAIKAGIMRSNFNLSTHTLRHTCATRLVMLGVDLETVRQHMRHSSLATTQRYLHEKCDLRPHWAKMNDSDQINDKEDVA